eukprot:jgi/Chrzof1/3754/Cz13g07200.t1
MATHNASHCVVHLCEGNDLEGARQVLAVVALGNEVMAEAFVEGAENGNNDVLRLLLAHGASVNDGITGALPALWFAARNCHTSTVRLLLESGANIHASDDEALRIAAIYGHTSTVRLLVESGANIHAWDDAAVHSAAFHGYTDMLQLLLESGADLSNLKRR